jgi:putative oxidoreductase
VIWRHWAVLAGLSRFGGGVLTLLGLLDPLGPLGVMGSMAVASATAHRDKPIWVTAGGAELPVTNIAAATAVILNGPDKCSLDRALGTRLPGWITPLGLIVIILPVMYARSGGDSASEQDEAPEEPAGEEG